MTQQLPPAGWYPDPQDPHQQRYWNGASWTEHQHPAAPAGTTPSQAQQARSEPTGKVIPAAAAGSAAEQSESTSFGRVDPTSVKFGSRLRLHQGERPLLTYQPSLGGCWLQLVLTLGLYAIWRSATVFAVTNQRVIYKKGILNKTERSVPLSQIQDATVFTQLWVAGVQISTAGGGPSFERLAPITPEQARTLADRVLQSAHAMRASAFAPSTSMAMASAVSSEAPQPSLIEQIQQLAVLRDQGVVTVEEFERKKAELLARM